MKSYTDLEQSKKLAEILPLESADCYWEDDMSVEFGHGWHPQYVPCWSLAALLSATRSYCTRFELTLRVDKKYNLFAMGDNFVYRGFIEYPDGIDNPIDVCYEMIIKLKERNLL